MTTTLGAPLGRCCEALRHLWVDSLSDGPALLDDGVSGNGKDWPNVGSWKNVASESTKQSTEMNGLIVASTSIECGHL